MEIYKVLRKVAIVAGLAVLPYACQGGCSYSEKQADAAETNMHQMQKSADNLHEQARLGLEIIL